jgi:hypothetical protein
MDFIIIAWSVFLSISTAVYAWNVRRARRLRCALRYVYKTHAVPGGGAVQIRIRTDGGSIEVLLPPKDGHGHGEGDWHQIGVGYACVIETETSKT